MVFAVPAFAVIYYYFKKDVENNLRIKGLPADTAAYENTELYKPKNAAAEQSAKKKQ
jgi:hypothetical protein